MNKNVFDQPDNFTNRELSWLEFNQRILGEARDRKNPLFERMKFLSITASNLDEFFMVRIASLKDMVNAGYQKKDIAGMTAQEQLRALNEKMQAFGWASVAIAENGETLEDWQGDIIEPDELESAAYKFVDLYREGGEMHERGGVAYLIESVVFTEEKMAAMGIPEGTLPVGWWIGFQVTDADVWEKVKDGTYSMFSIEGKAERVEVTQKMDCGKNIFMDGK